MTPEDLELIEKLVSDRKAFNEFVYTSLDEATGALEERQTNKILEEYLKNGIPSGIPDVLKKEKCAVLSRPVATPNYELLRFFSIADAIGFNPVIGEFLKSKFVSENESKYALARMCFYFGHDKKGDPRIESVNIVDFNHSTGKKVSEVKTKWGESLVDFHHGIFLKRFPKNNSAIFDESDWFYENGGVAKNYYKPLLSLFLKNAILFENFMLDVKELSFTKEIFLPAFITILKETKLKPLIVALEPTEIEGDRFWMCYPGESMDFVKQKISLL